MFRVATVYLGTGFVVLEAADMILPRLGMPDWTITFIMILLGLGFPISIGLAWTFQFTPEGLKRSPKSGEKQGAEAKPLTGNGIIIILLMLILGVLSYPTFFNSSGSNTDSAFSGLDPKSVAVLPFTPFTKTDEDQSFADGVHDDILTQLSKIGELKVISRTSVMKYKETTKSIPDIAQELGVMNLLEGSVRRAGDQVRVVAQLINAQTDEHLWAETYDREYADIFTLQSDVAKKIARALKAELTPREQEYIDVKPTENQKAWELYTRGQLLENSDIGSDSAITLYEQAILLDPEFLLPFTRLAKVQAFAYFDGSGRDPSPERLKKAEVALERAISIDHDAPETHLAQGYFHYYGARDYQQALDAFYIAQERQPNNSDLLTAIGYVERRLGQWDKSWEHLEKGVLLDPNNLSKVMELTNTAQLMRNWENVDKYQKHASAIGGGNNPGVEIFRYWNTARQYGDPDKLQKIYDELVMRFDSDDLGLMKQWHHLFTRDYKGGLDYSFSGQAGAGGKGFWLALNGREDEAAVYSDSSRMRAEERIAENPEDWDAYGDLGGAFGRLGRCEEAISWAEKGVEVMPLSRDALEGPKALNQLARVLMHCGDHDGALELIEQLLSIPSELTVATLCINPIWDPLREDPRFQQLIGEGATS